MAVKPHSLEVGRQIFTAYADDTAFQFNWEDNITPCLHSFSQAAANLGLKTLWLQNLRSGPSPTSLQMDGNRVESVDSFIYFGSLQKSEDNSRSDIKSRISHVLLEPDMALPSRPGIRSFTWWRLETSSRSSSRSLERPAPQRHWICSCQPLETGHSTVYGAMVERRDGPR